MQTLGQMLLHTAQGRVIPGGSSCILVEATPATPQRIAGLRNERLEPPKVEKVSIITPLGASKEYVEFLPQALREFAATTRTPFDIEFCLQFDGSLEEAEKLGVPQMVEAFERGLP